MLSGRTPDTNAKSSYHVKNFLCTPSMTMTMHMFQKKRPDRRAFAIEQGPHTYVGKPLEDATAYTTQPFLATTTTDCGYVSPKETARPTNLRHRTRTTHVCGWVCVCLSIKRCKRQLQQPGKEEKERGIFPPPRRSDGAAEELLLLGRLL